MEIEIGIRLSGFNERPDIFLDRIRDRHLTHDLPTHVYEAPSLISSETLDFLI